MKPKKKFQWTQDLIDHLVAAKRRAQLKKEQNDPTPVIDLIYDDWVLVTGIKNISKGALKIKLSKIKNDCPPGNNDEHVDIVQPVTPKSTIKPMNKRMKSEKGKNKESNRKIIFDDAMKLTIFDCFKTLMKRKRVSNFKSESELLEEIKQTGKRIQKL